MLERLEADYTRSGKARLFDALRGFATGEDERSYARVAAELDMSEGAVRVALLRLRRRLGAGLRDEVRYLLRALEP